MSQTPEHMLFTRIETSARLRGRLIQSSYSFRTPVDIKEYRRIDEALVQAFGSDGSKTIGWGPAGVVESGDLPPFYAPVGS